MTDDISDLEAQIDTLSNRIHFATEDASMTDDDFLALVDQRSKLERQVARVRSSTPDSAPSPPVAQTAPAQPAPAPQPSTYEQRLETAEVAVEELLEARDKLPKGSKRRQRAEREWMEAVEKRGSIVAEQRQRAMAIETEKEFGTLVARESARAVLDEMRQGVKALRKDGARPGEIAEATAKVFAAGQLLGVRMHAAGAGPVSSRPASAFPGLEEAVTKRLEAVTPEVAKALQQRHAALGQEFARTGKITSPTRPPQTSAVIGGPRENDPRFAFKDPAGFFGKGA